MTTTSGESQSGRRDRDREPPPPSRSGAGRAAERAALQTASSATVSNPPSPASRLFTVAVVGLSGVERDKGAVGVGKSCLCNRFIRPLEDDYRTDHISTLSQGDFGGRVVNNDHWLYWGERSLICDSGSEVTFRLIEHTEFVDDESFQPLKGKATQREPYLKRCTALRLQSADKLMYICKDQLGLEHEYEQKQLPEGKASIDGFLCVYDTSDVPNRPSERQVEFVTQLLHAVLKTKKPVVLVSTKNDDASNAKIRDLEQMLSRKEFRTAVPLVGCSSLANVSVEQAFMLLGHVIDKTCTKPKIVSYAEASLRRKEVIDVATAAYRQKLRKNIQNHRCTWGQLLKELNGDSDFEHFCELCGRAKAQKLFRKYLSELRVYNHQHRVQRQLDRLPRIYAILVPDVAMLGGKSWDAVINYLQTLPDFHSYFQVAAAGDRDSCDRSAGGRHSTSSQPPPSAAADERANDSDSDREEERVPFALLHTREAEVYFHNHVAFLEAQNRRQKLLCDFSQLLSTCSQVTPGKPLNDVRIFLLGKECFESLPESDIQTIYDQHQKVLIAKSRQNFFELLLEQVGEVVELLQRRPSSKVVSTGGHSSSPYIAPSASASVTPADIAAQDLRALHDKLQEDARYRLLNRMHQTRNDMVDQFISFIANPFLHRCPQRCCVDTVIQRLCPDYSVRYNQKDVISPRRIIYPLRGNLVNVMIFGSEPLAKQVLDEFQMYVNDDLFEFNGTVFCVKFSVQNDCDFHDELQQLMDYRPNGILCAFSSRETLDIVQNMLLHCGLWASNGTQGSKDDDDLSSSLDRGLSLFNGLPIVLLLVCDPAQLDDLPYLQQQGALLAAHLNVVFIGLGSSGNAGCFTQDRRARFGGLLIEEQICQALSDLISLSVEYRASLSPTSTQPSGSRQLSRALCARRREPDCTVLVCLMCGDDFNVELVLAPLLSQQVEPLYGDQLMASAAVGGDLLSAVVTATQELSSSSSVDRSGVGAATEPLASIFRRAFHIDVFLPTTGHKMLCDLTIVAYHTAFHLCAEDVLYDGCIMFYSSKRRASFAHLNTFAHLFSQPVPMLMVAVGEVVDFFSDPETKTLVTDGNRLADRLRARFTNASRSMEQPSGIYTTFFEDVWKTKDRSYKGSTYFADTRSEGDHSPASDHHPGYLMPASSEQFISSYPASEQEKNGGECHYMTLSSFWSGASMPALAGSVACPTWEGAGGAEYQRFAPSQSSCISAGHRFNLSELRDRSDDQKVVQSSSSISAERSSDSSPGKKLLSAVDHGNLADHHLSLSCRPPSPPSCFVCHSRNASDGGADGKSVPAPLATPENVEINSDSLVSRSTLQNMDSIEQLTDQRKYFDPTVCSISGREIMDETASWLNESRAATSSSMPDESVDEYFVGHLHSIQQQQQQQQQKRHRRGKMGPCVAERVRKLDAELDLSATDPNASMASSSIADVEHPVRKQRGSFGTVAMPFRTSLSRKASSSSQAHFRSSSDECLVSKSSLNDEFGCSKLARSGHVASTLAAATATSPPSKDCGGGFVRRVASSFRLGRRKTYIVESKSVPHSPVTGVRADRVFVLPSFESTVGDDHSCSKRTGGESDVANALAQIATLAIGSKSQTDGSISSKAAKRKDADKSGREKKTVKEQIKKTLAGDSFHGVVKKKLHSASLSDGSISISGELSLKQLALSETDYIPAFVRKCVEFIEEEGVKVEGLYRVPGNQSQVVMIEQKFAVDANMSMQALDLPVSAVTTALKNFFANLSEPLISAELYQPLIEAMEERRPEVRLRLLHNVLRRLPTENRAVLRYIINHLRRVAEHVHVTSMDHRNLAKCWWPTLMRPHFENFESMAMMSQPLEELVQVLLDNPSVLE